MDLYLVSVFQNKGLGAVQALCDGGHQKIELRNSALIWAIDHHENELATMLLTRSDPYHRGGYPLYVALASGNAQMFDQLLAIADNGFTTRIRFSVLEELVGKEGVSPLLLNKLAKHFSDQDFQKVMDNRTETAQFYAQIAQNLFDAEQKRYLEKVSAGQKVPKPNLKDGSYYKESVKIQETLQEIQRCRDEVFQVVLTNKSSPKV